MALPCSARRETAQEAIGKYRSMIEEARPRRDMQEDGPGGRPRALVEAHA